MKTTYTIRFADHEVTRTSTRDFAFAVVYSATGYTTDSGYVCAPCPLGLQSMRGTKKAADSEAARMNRGHGTLRDDLTAYVIAFDSNNVAVA